MKCRNSPSTHIYIYKKEGAFFAIGQAASILEQSVYGIVQITCMRETTKRSLRSNVGTYR